MRQKTLTVICILGQQAAIYCEMYHMQRSQHGEAGWERVGNETHVHV